MTTEESRGYRKLTDGQMAIRCQHEYAGPAVSQAAGPSDVRPSSRRLPARVCEASMSDMEALNRAVEEARAGIEFWLEGNLNEQHIMEALDVFEAAVSARARAEERERAARTFFVRFDGPPSHNSGRFVEVETAEGLSVGPETSGAHWYLQDDGTWLLGPFGYAAAPVEERIRELEAERGDKTWCSYCDAEFSVEAGLEPIHAHIFECPEHPLPKALAENAKLREALRLTDNEAYAARRVAGYRYPTGPLSQSPQHIARIYDRREAYEAGWLAGRAELRALTDTAAAAALPGGTDAERPPIERPS